MKTGHVLHWPLSGKAAGLYMLIDATWEEFFSTRPICLGSHGYAICRGPKGGQVLVHRVIASAEPGQIVDHVNHDVLDNRGENLRAGGRGVNNANRRLPVTRGTTWDARRQRWMAQGKRDGRTYHLGHFLDRRDAIRTAHDWRMRNLPGYEDSVDWGELNRVIA